MAGVRLSGSQGLAPAGRLDGGRDARQPLRIHASSPSWIARSSLTESGISQDADDVTDRVAKIGDPVLAESALGVYPAGRYSDGPWISAAVIKRCPTSCRGDRHRRGTAPGT